VDKKKIRNILVICTGNSCRSIMAEGYLKKRAKEEQLDVEIKSAGTSAFNGTKPPGETLEMLHTEGIAPEGFEAKIITEEMVNWADIILAMESLHKEAIIGVWPTAQEKTHLLGKYNSNELEGIPDPIGRSVDFYLETFSLIKESIEEFIKWLKK
jgi:protein-tyrosine-phosphatase